MEWIEKIKSGDETTLQTYFKQYQPIIFKASRVLFLKNFDYEDWMQEGYIVFYRSVESYQENLGVTFGLYFKNNFHRHIISLIRRQNALKRRGDAEAFSLDDEEHQEYFKFGKQGQPIKYDISNDLLFNEYKEKFYESLDSEERSVLALYEAGFGITESSLMLGLPERVVKKKLRKAKSRLKKEIQQLFK